MSAKLSDLFENISLSAVISEGRVLKIAHNAAKDKINLSIEFDELVPMKELFTVNEILSEQL